MSSPHTPVRKRDEDTQAFLASRGASTRRASRLGGLRKIENKKVEEATRSELVPDSAVKEMEMRRKLAATLLAEEVSCKLASEEQAARERQLEAERVEHLENGNAATKIQAMHRGNDGRKQTMKKELEGAMVVHEGSIQIAQAIFLGWAAKDADADEEGACDRAAGYLKLADRWLHQFRVRGWLPSGLGEAHPALAQVLNSMFTFKAGSDSARESIQHIRPEALVLDLSGVFKPTKAPEPPPPPRAVQLDDADEQLASAILEEAKEEAKEEDLESIMDSICNEHVLDTTPISKFMGVKLEHVLEEKDAALTALAEKFETKLKSRNSSTG